jgi:hypothetical protein
MSRFSVNRWWALVLTLSLFVACFFLLSAQMPAVAHAEGGAQILLSDPGTPGGGYGDPDVPIGPGQARPGKQGVSRGGVNQVAVQSGVRTVGDGKAPISVAVMRLRLFLLSLRSFYLRF